MGKQVDMSIICKQALGPVASHGLKTLCGAPIPKGVSIRVGTCEDIELRALAETGKLPLVLRDEAYAFARLDGEYVLVGYDEKGLMYGCQELCERLMGGDALEGLSFSGEPYTKIRGIYTFLHNKDLEEEWFYNPSYWQEYFDRLAEDRYNSFNMVFSHQTFYLVPMFAYFLQVPEYPDVCPIGVDEGQIKRNGDMLRYISELAEQRGLDFILGIWQVTPWKGKQAGTVTGLTAENLKDYTYWGMKHVIQEFPAIKGLQIRANHESGIPSEEQTDFFSGSLFQAMAEADRPFIFDFRLWLAEPETVENAVKMVPGTRYSCKYWGEFLGAPYQPAKIVPGYSYSDFLRHPMETEIIYQVWNLGSPRLLLWGDADYVRRFVHSLKLGGGVGFEMNMHLAQKGYGNEPGYWRIFKHKSDEYFTYEYERYWLFTQLFGRLSYDPNCGEEVWMRKLTARFGSAAADVLSVYDAGSEIITFLIQHSLSDLNMYIWPEIDTGGLLDFYMQTPSSDVCVVQTVEEYVEGWMRNEADGRLCPPQSAQHFRDMASETLECVARLERVQSPSKELVSTIRDFKILAFLGLYHSEKILAAVALKTWYEAGDIAHLRESYVHIRKATICWEQLISQTVDAYSDGMVTGPNDKGSWRTKLEFVYEDEIRVAELLRMAERFAGATKAYDFGPSVGAGYPFRFWIDVPVVKGYAVEHGYTQVQADTLYCKGRRFGWEIAEAKNIVMPLVRIGDTQMDPFSRDTWARRPVEMCKGLRNALYEDAVFGQGVAVFRCDVEDGDYEVTVMVADQTANATMRGPMTLDIGGVPIGAFTAMPLDEVVKTARVSVRGGALRITFDGSWFVSGILVRALTPAIATMPYIQLSPGKAIVTATVTAPDGIAEVSIAPEGGAAVEMRRLRDGEYEADLESLLPFGKSTELNLTITAKTTKGLTSESAVKAYLCDKPSTFAMTHTPVETCKASDDISVEIRVESAYPLRRAVLHYSYVNQFEEMHEAEFTRTGDGWHAIIPGSYIDPQWDIMYYAELVDVVGNGVILPDMKKQTPYWVIRPER